MAIQKITASVLGNNAVTAANVAAGALSAADIADNSLTAAKLSTSTFAIDSLTVNTSDLVVDTANNRVGIGTSSPATLLDVSGTTPTITISDSQNKSWTSSDTIYGKVSFKTLDGSGIGTHETAYVGVHADIASSTTPAGRLVFGTSNSNTVAAETMTLDGNGFLGLGTSNPSALLTMTGNSDTSDESCMIIINDEDTDVGSQIPAIQFRGDDNNVGRIRGHGSLGLIFSGSSAQGNDLVVQSGSVGIGTSNPVGPLEIYAVEPRIHLNRSDSFSWNLWVGNGTTFTNSYFNIAEGSTSKLAIAHTTGNVGIGASIPSEALHIEHNTVSGGNNYIHMRKTDQASSQGIFIGMTTNNNNLRIMNRANNAITFHTQTSDTQRFNIDTTGVTLADGAMAYEQTRPFFSGANAGSYSTSTNLAYTKSTDQYSVTGDAFKARVRARAYTKYVHMKTNLTADNIMFFFRIFGYFYNYGVNECVRGGYTYQGGVIQEAVANAYNTNSNYTIGDFYRSSSGSYLCIRLDVHQTGYTEGEALVFFASHSNSVTRELEITDMQHRDDGNNAY